MVPETLLIPLPHPLTLVVSLLLQTLFLPLPLSILAIATAAITIAVICVLVLLLGTATDTRKSILQAGGHVFKYPISLQKTAKPVLSVIGLLGNTDIGKSSLINTIFEEQ